ncbi:hypothetical protein H2200_009893 [Cladophialophora chaetospira]|uniref:Uncharacterized protein n=1 Tax=Cladophialophora chaetospira TaxID=386627 RepID=A0AA38X3A0_9EURO|nr:hypothetical protein H2200_009893 [Cladophialophora chaetospira]
MRLSYLHDADSASSMRIRHIGAWLDSVTVPDLDGKTLREETDGHDHDHESSPLLATTQDEAQEEAQQKAQQTIEGDHTSSPASINSFIDCCRVCTAEILSEYVGEPCEISGSGDPPIYDEQPDGSMICSCVCRSCLAWILIPWVGRRCEKTGMYPRIAIGHTQPNWTWTWRDTFKVKFWRIKEKVAEKTGRVRDFVKRRGRDVKLYVKLADHEGK